METSLENILVNSLKAEMIMYINSHPNDFEQLIKLAICDKQPHSWKAAWLLSNCIDKNDTRVEYYVSDIIERLPKSPDGQQRDLINVLRKMEIKEHYIGEVFETCINIWSKLSKIPSVRSVALRLALKITEQYPDLYDEIAMMTEDNYLEPLSPGIKNSIRKALALLHDRLKNQ